MADHLPSLKRARSDFEDAKEASHEDFYPVGLYVGNDELEAMQLGNVQLGDERLLMAVVRVTSVSAHESSGGKDKSVSLDLIEGTTQPKPQATSEEDKAKALFGSKA